MELRRIDSDFADKERLYAINDEAFPEWERIPSGQMLAVMEQYDCTAWAIYHDNTMVGFASVMHSEDYSIGYIWFLAIAADCRGCGYGSATLRLLKEEYSGSQLVLDMEQLTPEANNYNQRISRLRFYERNGFSRAFMGMSYFGMDFELMSCPTPLRLNDFKSMLSKIANNGFRPRFYPFGRPRILFLHGFFASGQCVPATVLREALADKAKVVSPDLPLHPKAALQYIRNLCDNARPQLLVGNSCGSFYAQQIASERGIPALLGNPHFEMTKFLSERIGQHQYKSPRNDGKQDFTIDEYLINEFAELESTQFNGIRDDMKDRVWGLFGDNDTLAHYEPLFMRHYSHFFHFPGGHTPTAEEVKTWYAPLVETMLRKVAIS